MLSYLPFLPLAICLCLTLPRGAVADTSAPDADAHYQRISGKVGDRRLARWLGSPEWTVQQVASLAHGYDTGQQLTVEAVETAIAHRRAQARARAYRDLLEADLDTDGAVTRAELTRLALSLSGRARALLWLRHRRADASNDGRVDAEELRVYAGRRSFDHLSEAGAQGLRDLMALDMDGDGAVTVPEAERALMLLARALPVTGRRGADTAL